MKKISLLFEPIHDLHGNYGANSPGQRFDHSENSLPGILSP
jgi:hypothetical protein